MSETVLQWREPNGVRYRILRSQRPGSSHWNLLYEYQLPDESDWKRMHGKEVTSKPKVLPDD